MKSDCRFKSKMFPILLPCSGTNGGGVIEKPSMKMEGLNECLPCENHVASSSFVFSTGLALQQSQLCIFCLHRVAGLRPVICGRP